MPIEVRCSTCGTKYQIREVYIGKSARCKKCGSSFKVVPRDNAASSSQAKPDSQPHKSQPPKSQPSKSQPPQSKPVSRPSSEPRPLPPLKRLSSTDYDTTPSRSPEKKKTSSASTPKPVPTRKPPPRGSKPSSSAQGDDWDDLLSANLDDPRVGEDIDTPLPPAREPKSSSSKPKKKKVVKKKPKAATSSSSSGGGDPVYGFIYLVIAALFIFSSPWLYHELEVWEQSDEKTKKMNVFIVIGYQIGGKMGACFASVGLGLWFLYSAVRQFKGAE